MLRVMVVEVLFRCSASLVCFVDRQPLQSVIVISEFSKKLDFVNSCYNTSQPNP